MCTCSFVLLEGGCPVECRLQHSLSRKGFSSGKACCCADGEPEWVSVGGYEHCLECGALLGAARLLLSAQAVRFCSRGVCLSFKRCEC